MRHPEFTYGAVSIFLTALLLAGGCAEPPMRGGEVGALSKFELLEAMQRRADTISTIKTTEVATTVYVPEAMPWAETLEGKLGFRQPASLRFKFSHPVADVSCDLGRNDTMWWLHLVLPEEVTYREGRIGQPPPPGEAFPIHPEDIAFALGVSAFDLGRVTVEKKPGYYILSEVGVDPRGGVAILRRSWVEVDTLRVVRFESFDADGVVRLVARQREFVDLGGDPEVAMPTRIDFDWIDRGTLSLKLRYLKVGYPMPDRMFEAPEVD